MTRICSWCGTSFTAPTSRALYCSGPHRAKAAKARAAGLPPHAVDASTHPADAEPGEVRPAVVAWIAQTGIDATHPLAPAAVALAERVDSRSDTASALASAVGALRTALAELAASPLPSVSRIDLLRVRHLAARAGERDVVAALSSDACARMSSYEQAQR